MQEQVNDRALHHAFGFEFKVKDFIRFSLFLDRSVGLSADIMSAVERAKSGAAPNSIITRALSEKRDLP